MKRVFTVGKGISVPDGTTVYSFLNPKDSTSSLPPDLLEDFSLALGEIAPHRHSRIHVMPLVTQVTFVLRGHLEVWMKDPDHAEPYSLQLAAEQAVLTRPGTFLQFRNNTGAPCRILYVVSPAYLLVMEGDRIIYDDSIVLEEDWEELEKVRWEPEKIRTAGLTPKVRRAAAKRLARQQFHPFSPFPPGRRR